MINIHWVTLLTLCVVSYCVSAQRIIDVKYSIQTIVGTGQNQLSPDGLTGLATKINQPTGVFYEERSGDLYFSDTMNHRVRVLRNMSGLVETVAGNGTLGYSGEGILAVNSTLYRPYGIFVSNNNDIYIAGNYANRIHVVSSKDNKLYTFAGTGVAGFNGDGLLANQSRVYQPLDVKLINQNDPNNMRMIIADTYGNRVRSVNVTSMITKTISTLTNPFGMAMDIDANDMYFGCAYPINSVLRLNLDTNVITTVAGVSGNSTHAGDDGPAGNATFNNVNGVSVSPLNGDIFITEPNSNYIRKISRRNGIITTIAGSGLFGYNGDNQQDATKSTLANPRAITATKLGDVFFADTTNNRIRKLTAVCPSGYVMDMHKTVCMEACYGIPFNNSNVCGSRGKCLTIDTCSCESGYYGLDCSIPFCWKMENGECGNGTAVVIVEKVETSQLSNKSISISSSENNSTSNSSISISFPSDFSNYITNQTNSTLVSLLTAVSKGGENVTVSNTTLYSIVSNIVTVSLTLTNGEKLTVSKLETPIQILFEKPSIFSGNLTCMYYDELFKEWKADGVQTIIEEWTVSCLTSHLTSFSVIDINLKKEIVKPNNPKIEVSIKVTDSNGTVISSTRTTESNQLSEEAIIAISVSIAGTAIICCVVAVIVMVVICMIRRKAPTQ